VRSALGEDVTFVYGGSVNEGNCAQFASLDGASGVFVGRAAWSPDKWSGIEARVRGESQ
jgi:triosephosphate isomerase